MVLLVPAMRLAIVAFACSRSSPLARRAAKRTGTIKVHSLVVQGRQGASTKAGSRTRSPPARARKFPGARSTYFDRSRFDADLKRIQAFYADRGYPRRARHRLRRQAERQAGRGRSHRHDRRRRAGASSRRSTSPASTSIPPAHLDDLKKRVPLKVGQPRDRQLVVSTHEMAVNELKDHGFPYAQGRDRGRRRQRRQAGDADVHRRPGQARALRPGRNRRQQERRRAHHPPRS